MKYMISLQYFIDNGMKHYFKRENRSGCDFTDKWSGFISIFYSNGWRMNNIKHICAKLFHYCVKNIKMKNFESFIVKCL